MAEFIKIPKQYIDGKLLNYVPNGCEFPDELKYAPASNIISAHLTAIADEICWMRENMVRYTDLQSPSEFTANHPVWDLYVSTTGSDTTGLGTAAAPFATPHRALEYLERWVLRQIATVHIGAGTYSDLPLLLERHPNGKMIQMVGDGSGTTTLNFATSGIRVLSGFGLINALTITGTGIGLIAENNSYFRFGNDMIISGMGGDGIDVLRGTHGEIGSVLIDGCGGDGIGARWGTSVTLAGATITNSGGYGIRARDKSGINLQGTVTSTGNGIADYSPAVGTPGNNDSLIY